MPEKLNRAMVLMLVDDNMVDLKINKIIATHTKLFTEIISFSSGEGAIDYLAEHLDKPNLLPQLILLDIQMPEMSGFEFMERYERLPRQFLNECLVALLSSTDDLTDIARANSNPYIIKLLKKPLHPDTLKELVTAYFSS